MRIEQQDGLAVVITDTDEACRVDWRELSGEADLVRVLQPEPGSRRALSAAGFVVRPARVGWIAPAPRTEAEYVAHLSPKGREDLRSARRKAAASRLEISVRETVDSELFDAFLVLYRARIDRMRNGVPYAAGQRDLVLAEAERFFAVLAHCDGRLVGACIAERRPARCAVWIRFSAVDEERRRQSLARVLYLRAAVKAGAEGFEHVVLGADPNLYGHVVEVGLIAFKRRLGFVPRPTQELTPGDGLDVADRILRFGALADPSVMLCYGPSASPAEKLEPVTFTAGSV